MDTPTRPRSIGFGAAVDAERRRGAIVRLSSETDFVAMTSDFRALAEGAARAAAESGDGDVERVLDSPWEGATLRSALEQFSATCGETCRLDAIDVLREPDGVVGGAISERGEVAALVQLVGPLDDHVALEHSDRFASVLMELESRARERGHPGLIALSLETWVLDALVRAFELRVSIARCHVRGA